MADGELLESSVKVTFNPINNSLHDKLEISAWYLPGKLTFYDSSYHTLLDDSTSYCEMNFLLAFIKGKKTIHRFYNIKVRKNWLQEDYCIIKIFNNDINRKKPKVKALSDTQPYNFGISTPNYMLLPVLE